MNTAQYKTWDEFMEGVWRQNPVFVMVLGMCPTLAVTVSAINAISMGVATLFALVCSCGLVSLMRKLTPKEVRIAVYIVIIATFVTAFDYAIQAISLALYDALGAFIQLIVVNCIILGRATHAERSWQVGLTLLLAWVLLDDLRRYWARGRLRRALRGTAPRKVVRRLVRAVDRVVFYERRKVLAPRSKALLKAWKRVHIPFSMVLLVTMLAHIAIALRLV